ncbi:XRE family transcriptional regulator [Oxalobacter sp. OttesenSCG-928-P03]|nr:XRE family transcriptional regulator [Oxalobacter sp. OttesenSCG-928-P03]
MQANQVNHKMIVLGRESRELTQSGLSRITKIAQGTLSKIEAGILSCPVDLLQKISNALEYPVSFFYMTSPLHGIGTESHHHLYRKRAAIPSKTIKRIEADINIKRIHLENMLSSFDIDCEKSIPFLDPQEFDSDIERIAGSLRSYWNIPSGPIENLTELIEQAGGIVILHDFGSDRVDATSLKITGLPPLFFVNKNLPGDRLRFTLAHELGHVVMHSIPHPNVENEADRFAAEFLMPAADIGHMLSRIDLAKAAKLKPYWKTSMAAIIYRAHELGKITQNQYRYLFYQLSASGYKTSEPKNLDIKKEIPSVHSAMLDFLRDDLGYSQEDLMRLFNIFQRDFSKHYLQSTDSGRLRVVK